MRTAVVMMSDGSHLITQSTTDDYKAFRERVAAKVIEAVRATGKHPVQLMTANGCGYDLCGEGAGEIYEMLRIDLGVWDGAKFVASPGGTTKYRDYLQAFNATVTLGAGHSVMPLA